MKSNELHSLNKTKPKGNPNWIKGKSGNPAGRPHIPEEFKELARKYSPIALRVVIDILKNPKKSDYNRLKAAEMIIERYYGKPTQAIESGDKLSQLIVKWIDEK